MSRRRVVWARVAVAVIVASAGGAPADAKGPGRTSAPFLTVPVEARSTGMADAFTAAATGATAVWTNPASIARHHRTSISVAHVQHVEGISQNAVAAAYPFGNGHAVAAGLRLFQVGSITSLDASGAPAGDFSPSDAAFSLGYGKRFTSTALGVSFKFVRSKVSGSDQTVAFDAGIHQRVGPVHIGLAAQNNGGALAVGREKFPLPRRLRTGLSWAPIDSVLLTADYVAPKYGEEWIAAGAEYRLAVGGAMALAVRGGYSTRNVDDVAGLSGLSGGASVGFRSTQIHYAYVPFGRLGDTHRLSLDFGFDPPKRRAKDEEPIEDRPVEKKVQEAVQQAIRIPPKPWRQSPLQPRTVDKPLAAVLASRRICDEDGPSALLSWRKGAVSVISAHGDEAGNRRIGDPYLFPGDIVNTRDGTAQVVFMNGTRMELDDHVRSQTGNPDDRCADAAASVDRGTARIYVPAEATASIKTPFGGLRFKGAQARVDVQPTGLVVDVPTGTGAFSSKGGETPIEEGTRLSYDRQAGKVLMTEIETGSILAPATPALGGDISGRWDPAFSARFKETLAQLASTPGIEIAEYVRDEKLRNAYDMIGREMRVSIAELENQKRQFAQDLENFEGILASGETSNATALVMAMRQAENEIREINRKIRAREREIRRSQVERAKLPLGRIVNVTANGLPFPDSDDGMGGALKHRLDLIADAIRALEAKSVTVEGVTRRDATVLIGVFKVRAKAKEAARYLSEKSERPIERFDVKGRSGRGSEEEAADTDRINVWLELRGL